MPERIDTKAVLADCLPPNPANYRSDFLCMTRALLQLETVRAALAQEVADREADRRRLGDAAQALVQADLREQVAELDRGRLEGAEARIEALDDDVCLLEKVLQDAIDNKPGWDLSARAMVHPVNRMLDRMRRAGATPEEAKAAFDVALAAEGSKK